MTNNNTQEDVFQVTREFMNKHNWTIFYDFRRRGGNDYETVLQKDIETMLEHGLVETYTTVDPEHQQLPTNVTGIWKDMEKPRAEHLPCLVGIEKPFSLFEELEDYSNRLKVGSNVEHIVMNELASLYNRLVTEENVSRPCKHFVQNYKINTETGKPNRLDHPSWLVLIPLGNQWVYRISCMTTFGSYWYLNVCDELKNIVRCSNVSSNVSSLQKYVAAYDKASLPRPKIERFLSIEDDNGRKNVDYFYLTCLQ